MPRTPRASVRPKISTFSSDRAAIAARILATRRHLPGRCHATRPGRQPRAASPGPLDAAEAAFRALITGPQPLAVNLGCLARLRRRCGRTGVDGRRHARLRPDVPARRGVLSADSVTAMTTDQITPEQKARGGLGPDFFNGQSSPFCQAVRDNGSFGWNGGFGTTWLVNPRRDLVVIVYTQRMFESPDAPPVIRDIQPAAAAARG